MKPLFTTLSVAGVLLLCGCDQYHSEKSYTSFANITKTGKPLYVSLSATVEDHRVMQRVLSLLESNKQLETAYSLGFPKCVTMSDLRAVLTRLTSPEGLRVEGLILGLKGVLPDAYSFNPDKGLLKIQKDDVIVIKRLLYETRIYGNVDQFISLIEQSS